MINSRDSSYDNIFNAIKIYEVPFKVGDIIEKKDNDSIHAKIEQIIIDEYGMKFILNYDRNLFDINSCDIVSKEDLIINWKEPTKIVIWKKLNVDNSMLKFAKVFDKKYSFYDITKRRIKYKDK